MTIEELQSRLRDLHARIGYEGRFAFTLNQKPGEECYVTHWFRKGDLDFEDCRAVGVGTVEECLAALDDYVSQYRRRPTEEEVGRALGIIPAPRRYKLAAE